MKEVRKGGVKCHKDASINLHFIIFWTSSISTVMPFAGLCGHDSPEAHQVELLRKRVTYTQHQNLATALKAAVNIAIDFC